MAPAAVHVGDIKTSYLRQRCFVAPKEPPIPEIRKLFTGQAGYRNRRGLLQALERTYFCGLSSPDCAIDLYITKNMEPPSRHWSCEKIRLLVLVVILACGRD